MHRAVASRRSPRALLAALRGPCLVAVGALLLAGCGAAAKSAAPASPSPESAPAGQPQGAESFAAPGPGGLAPTTPADPETGGLKDDGDTSSMQPSATTAKPSPAPTGGLRGPLGEDGGQGNPVVSLITHEEEEERLLLGAVEGLERRKAGSAGAGSGTECQATCTSLASLQKAVQDVCDVAASSSSTASCNGGRTRAAELAARARKAGCDCPAR